MPAAAAPATKPPKFYPADDVKKPLINKRNPRPTKLRASVIPGTVLIIVAERFKGKRVVFLRRLSSGYSLKVFFEWSCFVIQFGSHLFEQDIKTGKDLLEEDFVKKNPGWVEELTLMVKTKQKAEIQALSSFGFQYVSEVYLPLKLQQQDWL